MRRQWKLLVRLVQRAFGDSTPLVDLTWETMVLIPKGKIGYQGIGIVDVASKVCAAVVNFRLDIGVLLHDALYGFR